MAYAVPFEFSHGTDPTSANFNTYVDALNDLHGRAGDVRRFPLVLLNREMLPGADSDNCGYTFRHRKRYLWYRSSGSVVSIDGTQSVSLSNTNSNGVNVYDLDSITWLAYGDIFRVQGVTWTLENDTSGVY